MHAVCHVGGEVHLEAFLITIICDVHAIRQRVGIGLCVWLAHLSTVNQPLLVNNDT
jgi:hypothetical protein